MKKIINKTTMAIILAISMVLALFSGLLFVRHNEVANAATPVTVTFTSDKEELFPGDTFKLTMTIDGSGASGVYHSVSIAIGLLADAQNLDDTNASLFTFSNQWTNVTTSKNRNTEGHGTTADFTESSAVRGNTYLFSLSKVAARPGIAVSEPIEFTMDVAVSSSAPMNTSYKFGAQAISAYYVRTVVGTTQTPYTLNNVTVTDVDVLVREASDNNNLDGLKVGQGDDADKLTEITNITETGMTVTLTDPSMPLSVLPTPEHAGAKVVLKPGDIAVEKDKIGKIPVPANGKVTIEVEAENGDKKTYELTVTIKGAALTALTVTPDSTTEGVTKKGLDLTATDNAFDPAVEAYTVYVPNDSENIAITAVVNTTYSGSPTMDIVKAGTWNSDSTATSNTAFNLTGVKDAMADNDTLSIKCKDTDGNVTKTYVLTFDVVDVDTSLSADPTVVGTTTSKTFANSTLRAEENNKDYYYMLVGDTTANVTIVSKSSTAVMKLDGADYTSNTAKSLGAGEYTLKVEAEAGNSKEYKIVLKNQELLKLKAGITADFVYDNSVTEYGFTYHYVKSYKSANMTHGISDINFEKVVIGKVAESTTVMDFLANFETALSSIRLYNYDDELVYDCGQAGADFDESQLDDPDELVIGTGWRVELIISNQVEDTLYVSVLGDIDASGTVDTNDSAMLVAYVNGSNTSSLDDLEFYLAALVTNAGSPSAADITDIGSHFKGDISIPDEYFGSI